jgi:hypothetical protein
MGFCLPGHSEAFRNDTVRFLYARVAAVLLNNGICSVMKGDNT